MHARSSDWNACLQSLGWQIFFACMMAVLTSDTLRSAQAALGCVSLQLLCPLCYALPFWHIHSMPGCAELSAAC